MKREVLALWRTFVLVAFVPALAFSLAACEPDNDEGGDTAASGVVPEVSVPNGYVNYFIEDLSFSRAAGEAKVAFQINVGWTMVVAGSPSWCSVEPASGDAGLHKVVVRVADNDTNEPRSAKIHLMSGSSKVAEIAVIQEEGTKYEAVDLGLSVKWASCNVGANSPEEYGGYYAWGETEEKTYYSWSTYKWCNGSYNNLTKYCTGSSSGTVDNRTTLEPEDDVAHVKWGGNWRMPTRDEQEELCTKCNWAWTTMNGVKGYQVTGPNGNSIFLPAASHRIGTDVDGRGSYGSYWSATLYENSRFAYIISFYDGYYNSYCFYYRYYGQVVRPVSEE